MEMFVSEPLEVVGETRDLRDMAGGLPGLPVRFRWRGGVYAVVDREATWKASSPEGGRPGNEMYLRRHYYRLRMGDGSHWTVYFERQARRGASPKRRWYLYTVETG